ncbi:VanW family protein [Brevibacillus borstelensis]|uniref:VanW family protein n=1 Tax=Brevibacillus borstelensis TaxID=45462 RepID=UPI002E1CBD9C|nr:VanW family protein [Brevibacillus borstelensis]
MLEKKQYKLFGGAFALLLIQSCVFGAVSLLASGLWDQPDSEAGGRLSDVQVAGLSLAGLTIEEARASVKRKVEDLSGMPAVLTLEDRTYLLDKEKLGLRFEAEETIRQAVERSRDSAGLTGWFQRLAGKQADGTVPLAVHYDRSELVRQVERIAGEIDRKAVAATLRIENNKAVVIPDQAGYQVDVEETVSAVETEFRTLRYGLRIPIKAKKDEPAITRKDLEKSVDLLGEWNGTIGTEGPSRLVNVKRAAELLNGTILMPDQVFSFNEAAGPFTTAKGYQLIDERQAIPDGLGGSAVQVASALYETALTSSLSVVERHSAKRPVDFQRIGLEAFVNGRDMDLRLANRMKTPVYIHAAVEQGRLRVALYGSGQSLEKGKPQLMAETTETFSPGTIVRVDRDMKPNQERIVRVGEKGLRAKVFLYDPGSNKKVLVSDNLYQPVPNVIAVGPREVGAVGTKSREDDWPTEAEAEPWVGSEAEEELPPEIIYGSVKPYGDSYAPADTGSSARPPDIAPLPENAGAAVPQGSASVGAGAAVKVEKNNGVIILHDAPER